VSDNVDKRFKTGDDDDDDDGRRQYARTKELRGILKYVLGT
jgi:hypothetical protein